MQRRRLSLRILWLLTATLQISLGAVAMLAEVRASAGADPAYNQVHVEPRETRHGPPPHSAPCVVCQYLSAKWTPAETARPPSLREIPIRNSIAQPERRSGLTHLSLPLPRAPPLV